MIEKFISIIAQTPRPDEGSDIGRLIWPIILFAFYIVSHLLKGKQDKKKPQQPISRQPIRPEESSQQQRTTRPLPGYARKVRETQQQQPERPAQPGPVLPAQASRPPVVQPRPVQRPVPPKPIQRSGLSQPVQRPSRPIPTSQRKPQPGPVLPPVVPPRQPQKIVLPQRPLPAQPAGPPRHPQHTAAKARPSHQTVIQQHQTDKAAMIRQRTSSASVEAAKRREQKQRQRRVADARKTRQEQSGPAKPSIERKPLQQTLQNRDNLSRAIVMAEILGKPLALREKGSHELLY
ncbi:MAG: hypothetical protein JW860_11330 [Sedimentisphaerales bacterium]|nr:hypothetical protein [Sedimentisphaerales bacterium]